MAADNTLGAPTEGLGQTVTFTADSRGGGVPQAQADQRQALRNNATGGAAVRTAQALQVQAPKGDSFFQVMAKLGGEIIKPMVEAERTLKFYEGVNAAAKGQAIAEIVDEQPWYSKVFGSSSLVDGARAHTASATATALATELEVDMPNFRKLSDQEAVRYVTDRVTKLASTGDTTADAMIVQQATTAIAPVLKNRTKAAINYLQEQRQEATVANYSAQFANLQAVHNASQQPGATVNAGDALMTTIGALSAMVREDGTSEELHSKMVTTAAMKAASSGNLLAYTAIKASGKFDELTPQDQYQLTRAHANAVNEAKIKMPEAFSDRLVEFGVMEHRAGTTPEMLKAKRNEINQEWKRLTGDQEDYIGTAALRTELVQLDAAERQREAAAERENAKANTVAGKAQQKQDDMLASLAQASDFSSPDSFMVRHTPAERKEVFEAARQVFANNPAAHMTFVAHQANALIYDDALEKTHAAELNTSYGAQSAEGIHRYYTQQYLPLVVAGKAKGEEFAQHYAGKFGDFMARYHAVAKQKASPNELELQVFFKHADTDVKPVTDSKRVTEIADAIKTNDVMSMLGKVVNSDSLALVEPRQLAAKIAKSLPGVRDIDDEYATYLRENRQVSVIGGHFWNTPVGATRVDEWITKDYSVSPNEVNRATRLTIDKAAKEVGISGNPLVHQIVDTNGMPNLFLVGVADDGVTTRMRHIPAQEIRDNWSKRDVAPERVDRGRLPEGEWQATMDRLASKPK